MANYAIGQVVKGKAAPAGCPEGTYWRKVKGKDEFKLYEKHERQVRVAGVQLEDEGPRLTARRVAAGIRVYMQHQEGFKQVMDIAALSGKALQNLAQWTAAAAEVKLEAERVKTAAVAKANAALKDVGLMITRDGLVQPLRDATMEEAGLK